MSTFAANDAFVIQHNKEGHSYTVGHNEFSDLTSTEFAKITLAGGIWQPN